jgi:phenylacetate-CoA ligase
VSRLVSRAEDLVRRRGVWEGYRLLRESQWWPPERIREHQNTKLQGLVRFAARHSPYYAEALAAARVDPESFRGIEDLGRLPILTREILRGRADAILSRGVPRSELTPNNTSGSTGSIVRFFGDRENSRWRDAVDLRLWDIAGFEPGVPVMYLWGSPLDEKASRRWIERLRRPLENRRLFSSHRLDGDAIRSFVDVMARQRPVVLMGYATVLDLVATDVRKRGLPWPRIPGLTVISSAEVLYPEQRRNIAEALGARVLNLYGCREVGLIAMECEAGGFHVMEERHVVELLPGDFGTPARILITDLDNRGFPFIRYEVGDLASEDPSPCPCGRGLRKLTALTGRSIDVLRGPSGQAISGNFLSFLLRERIRGVECWQAVQSRPDLLEIRLTPVGALAPGDRERIVVAVKEALGASMEVRIEETDRLEPLPSGKHRFIVAYPGATTPTTPR